MLKKLFLLALIFSVNKAYAISATTSPKIANNTALERIQAYAASSTKAKKLGILEPGTEVIEYKTFMKTKPGLAIMEDNSWDKSVPFDRGSHIYIWEYLNDGFSKVVINGVRYNTKIARSKSECKRFAASPRYCWAKVIEEPEYYEWKQLALQQDGQRFWILNRIVDGSGIISLKDQGVSKTRLVATKYVEPKPKVDKQEVIEEKVDNMKLLDPELKAGSKPQAPQDQVAVELSLTKEERAKLKAEAKAKLKAELAKEKTVQPAPIEMTQQEMFKQQGISKLETNFDENSTNNTLKQVNQELGKPATKLKLEKNKPLTLPVGTYGAQK